MSENTTQPTGPVVDTRTPEHKLGEALALLFKSSAIRAAIKETLYSDTDFASYIEDIFTDTIADSLKDSLNDSVADSVWENVKFELDSEIENALVEINDQVAEIKDKMNAASDALRIRG